MILGRSVGPVSSGPSSFFVASLKLFLVYLKFYNFLLDLPTASQVKLRGSSIKQLGKVDRFIFQVLHLVEVSVQNGSVHLSFLEDKLLFHKVLTFLHFLFVHESQNVKNRRRLRETLFRVIFDRFLVLRRCPGVTFFALFQVLYQSLDKVFGLRVNVFIKRIHLFGLSGEGLEEFKSISHEVIEFAVFFLDVRVAFDEICSVFGRVSKVLMGGFGFSFEFLDTFEVPFEVLPLSFKIELKLEGVIKCRDLDDFEKFFHGFYGKERISKEIILERMGKR